MQANKINYRIQNQQQSFENFINKLKQQRSERKKYQYINNNQMKEVNHNHSHNSKGRFEVDSNVETQGWKSLYLNRHQSTQIKNNKYGGDQTLKLRGKIGVANRSSIKEFQLPSKYFTPIKSKLQDYLKNSRLIPNVELLPNIKMDHTSKKYLFSQDQMSMLSESKVLRGQTNTNRLSQVNPSIVLKYCFIHSLTASSDIKDILMFFVRLLQMLGYSIPEPTIQKYKDCVYFGAGIKKKQIRQGFLYCFKGSLYVGDLMDYSMHGRGIQIFFHVPAIFKGDFKQGTMHGYFEVTKDNEKYCGMVENGVYHGHGKLVTRNGIVQGQFRQGKIVSVSKNLKEASIVKNHSNFRIRETLDRNVIEEYIQTSNLFDKLSPTVFSVIKKEDESNIFKQRNNKLPIKQQTPQIKSADLLQKSCTSRNQMIQKATQQYYQNTRRFTQINPEIIVDKRVYIQPKQRMNGHLTKSIQTIRQVTELGYQQPLQFKR